MSWKVGHPIKRDGTNQMQRLLDALQPERNPVDDRQVEDLLLFIYRLADQFAFYNERNVADGDWTAFFAALRDSGTGQVSIESIRRYLSKAEHHSENSVFLSILLAFLQIFGHLQQDINTLTKKHLDFYYEQVLGFRRLPPVPDEVHVLLELAPHIRQHLLPAGTTLKAGKDALGKPLTYVTNRDIVVNKAKLSAIKTALITPEGRVYAAEVANSADGLGAPIEAALPKWPLFGDPDSMQASAIGLAIASPLLLLQEGQRLINLTLTFKKGIPEELTEEDFRVFWAEVSGPEGWVHLSNSTERQLTIKRETSEVLFFFALKPTQPALVGYLSGVLDGNLDTKFPVMRLLIGDKPSKHALLKKLALKKVGLTVSVLDEINQLGVQNLVLQNDQGPLDKNAAFQPFGSAPAKNARFYIGSREVFCKPLEEVTIQLRWADLPDDQKGFEDHYAAYPVNYKKNGAYTVSFQVLSSNQWSDVFAGETGLFNGATGMLLPDKTITIKNSELSNLPIATDLPDIEVYHKSSQQGFIRLSLEQNFGHQAYPKLLATAAKGVNASPPNPAIPNPPYTPTLQSISLGYTASQTITPGLDDTTGRLYHIQPFGSEELPAGSPNYLMPQVPKAVLYLGFADFDPPQNLHLLFQIAEGSAESTEAIVPGDISWHYLTDRGWRDTALSDSEIFIDSTLGLQKSGILAFQIGRDAGKNATQLPHGLYWLRASIQKDPAGAARARAIHTQATTAVFQENDNDPAHLSQVLPEGAITALVERSSAIRKVEQPYSSFGGLPAEPDQRFYTRVSERLRHKQRAVTLWDIERLTLQQFPALYEVKAIPHTGVDENGFYSEFQPGQVTVVLVPQLRNRNAVNPLQPRASSALLEEARRYLLPLCMPFAQGANALQVVNPRYEPVLLSFSVGFRSGYDSGYYADVLQEALRRRLSPWAYEEGEDIRFGGRVYKSQLLAFVEEQAYVDYVTDFKMMHARAEPGVGEMSVENDLFVYFNSPERDTDVAIASTAASILVSAERHHIQTLRPDEFPCENPDDTCNGGIDCWYVDIDFIVSEQ